MKINVLLIIKSHIATLKDFGGTRSSFIDIIIFFITPLCLGAYFWYADIGIDRDAYAASISVFAIFAALLFNVEVAMFGILQRGWRFDDHDNMLKDLNEQYVKDKMELLGEVNTNVSYLIMISCVSVSFVLM